MVAAVIRPKLDVLVWQEARRGGPRAPFRSVLARARSNCRNGRSVRKHGRLRAPIASGRHTGRTPKNLWKTERRGRRDGELMRPRNGPVGTGEFSVRQGSMPDGNETADRRQARRNAAGRATLSDAHLGLRVTRYDPHGQQQRRPDQDQHRHRVLDDKVVHGEARRHAAA